MKAKKLKSVDLKSNAINSLSEATNLLNEVSNSLVSTAWNNALTSSYVSPSTLGNISDVYYNQGNCVGYVPTTTTVLPNYTYVTPTYPKIDITKIVRKLNSNRAEIYEVNIYIAGVNKERVVLILNPGNWVGSIFYPGNLTININSEEIKVDGNYFLKESKQSYASRVVPLPQDADVLNAETASLHEGILTFFIPITEIPAAPKAKYLAIE